MTPNFGMRPLTDEERKAMAGQMTKQLAKSAPVEIAQRHPEMSLLGIEQNILDLVAFRQDAIERLAALEALNDPEASDEIGEVRAELEAGNMELAKMAGAEVAKVDNCANLIRMCDRMQAHCKDERDRQARKAKRWESIKESVERVVIEALEITGRTSFDSPTNRLRVQRNSAPRVEVTHPSMVQDRFIRVLVQFPLDLWKAIKTACPDLTSAKPLAYSPLELKDQAFATAEIAKVMKEAAKKDEAERAKDPLGERSLTDRLKEIERVKGVELKYGKHLRVE